MVRLFTLLQYRLLHQVIHDIKSVYGKVIINFIHVLVVVEYLPHKREELFVNGRTGQHSEYLHHKLFELRANHSANFCIRFFLLSDIYHDLFYVFDAPDSETFGKSSQLQLRLVCYTDSIES
jgi:hypothetical protein